MHYYVYAEYVMSSAGNRWHILRDSTAKFGAGNRAHRAPGPGHNQSGMPSPDRTPEGLVHSETCLTTYTGTSA